MIRRDGGPRDGVTLDVFLKVKVICKKQKK